jgi:hypothetical protein
MASRVICIAVSLALLAGGAVAIAPAADAESVPVATQSGVVDAASASDQGTAQAIAAAYGHEVIVDGATTDTSLTKAEPDGSMQLSLNSVPVRVQRNGAWIPTDSSLAAVDGMLQPAAAAVPVQFSAGGSAPLARVQSPSGEWLSEVWQAGALPAPTVAGDTATYADVYPGVDLALKATATGMSEVLVVKNATAASNPALADVGFGVEDGSLTTTAQTGGTVVATGADGSTQLTSTAATWWDSSSAGASVDGPGGAGVPAPVSGTVSDTQVTIDAAVPAQKPGVTYPVYVDPSWAGHATGWAMVDSTYPTTPYWEGSATTAQHVGHVDAANSPDDHRDHTARSYWSMDVSAVHATHITTATFNAQETYSFSCSPRTVQLWTAGAATSITTWNTQPGLATLSDSVSAAYGYSSACGVSNIAFDATAAVQRVATAGSPVLNLALVAANESDIYGWKKFNPSTNLVIGYESYPVTPAFRAVTPCFAVCGSGAIVRSTLPTFQAWSNIADSGVNLSIGYEICVGAGTGACEPIFHSLNIPRNTIVTHAMPPGTPLHDGNWVYRLQACRATDSTLCSAWTTFFPFVVDTTAPPAPAVTSNDLDLSGNTTKGAEGTPASLGFGAAGGTDDLLYGWSTTPGAYQLTSPRCPQNAPNKVQVLCASGSPAASFTPQSMSGTLTVYAFDKAGNASAATTVQYKVFSTLAANADHGWYGAWSDFDAAPQPASVADANANGVSSLQLGNVGWLTNGQDPAGPTTGPTVDASIPQSHDTAWQFDGTSSLATSSTTGSAPVASLDATHSLAVAAWVKPDPSSSGTRVIMSQDNADGSSSFTLQENAGGYWQTCIQLAAGSAGTDAQCATGTVPYANDGTWTLVVGEWNAATGGLQVFTYNYDASGFTVVSTGGSDVSPVVSRTAASIPAASPNPVLLGRDQSTSHDRWRGGITDPIAYSSYVDPAQFTTMWYSRPVIGDGT